MQSSGGEFQESLIRKQPSCRFPTILPVSLHNSRTILSKLEPVVGLEPTTDGLQNRCSTTELNWRRYLNHQLELKIPTGVGEVPDSICVPVSGRFCGSEKGPPFTSRAQRIVGGIDSMASQFSAT